MDFVHRYADAQLSTTTFQRTLYPLARNGGVLLQWAGCPYAQGQIPKPRLVHLQYSLLLSEIGGGGKELRQLVKEQYGVEGLY